MRLMRVTIAQYLKVLTLVTQYTHVLTNLFFPTGCLPLSSSSAAKSPRRASARVSVAMSAWRALSALFQ